MSRKSNCYGVSIPPKSSGTIQWDTHKDTYNNTIQSGIGTKKKKNVP